MYLFIERLRKRSGGRKRDDRPKFIDRWPLLSCSNFYEIVVLAVINKKTPPLNRLASKIK